MCAFGHRRHIQRASRNGFGRRGRTQLRRSLKLDCIAEFTPASGPGIAMRLRGFRSEVRHRKRNPEFRAGRHIPVRGLFRHFDDCPGVLRLIKRMQHL